MDPTAERDPKPWDRRVGESELDYHRFRLWLTEPSPRVLKGFAEKIHLSYKRMRDVSAYNDWTARTFAWDTHLAPEIEAITKDEAKERHRQHLALTRGIIGGCSMRFREGLDDLSAYHAGRLALDALVKERLCLGEATERQDRTVEVVRGDPDPSRLTEEERAEWGALMEVPEVVRFLELDDKARGFEDDADGPAGA